MVKSKKPLKHLHYLSERINDNQQIYNYDIH